MLSYIYSSHARMIDKFSTAFERVLQPEIALLSLRLLIFWRKEGLINWTFLSRSPQTRLWPWLTRPVLTYCSWLSLLLQKKPFFLSLFSSWTSLSSVWPKGGLAATSVAMQTSRNRGPLHYVGLPWPFSLATKESHPKLVQALLPLSACRLIFMETVHYIFEKRKTSRSAKIVEVETTLALMSKLLSHFLFPRP